MRGSTAAEMVKLVKRPAMWILAAVFLLLNQVFGYLIPYLIYRTGGGGGFAGEAVSSLVLLEVLPDRIVPNVLGGFPLFAGAIALILGALVAASEYGWGTLKTILTQRPRRLSVLGGKLATIGSALLALVLVTFALSALWSWVIATAESRPADWPSVLELTRGIGAGWLILAVWAGLGVVLGVLFRSTSLAVGLGLVWALVVENLIRGFAGLLGFLDAFQKGLPGVNAGSLVASLGAALQGDTNGTPGVTAAVSGPQAAVVLVAYAVILSAIAILTLRRQDVT